MNESDLDYAAISKGRHVEYFEVYAGTTVDVYVGTKIDHIHNQMAIF